MAFPNAISSTLAIRKVVTDKFIYDDTFPSFKAGTDQKEIIARINQAFNNNLQKNNIIFFEGASVKIADICCGPCDVLIKYLENITFSGSFSIYAIDLSAVYAGEDGEADPHSESAKIFGQAHEHLLAAKINKVIPIKDFTIKRGNAFAGNLNKLLRNSEECSENSFNIVFMSHSIYHAVGDKSTTCSEIIQIVVNDIAKNLLAEDGVAILYHNAYSKSRTRWNFSVEYGNTADKNSPADTAAMYEVKNPTGAISESCRKLDIPCYELEYMTRLYFSAEVKNFAKIFADPRKYGELINYPEILSDYYKLLFLVKRAPMEIFSDKSGSGLAAYIDDVMNSLCVTKNGLWYLPNVEKMQILLNPNASNDFKEQVKLALHQTKIQLPEVTQEGINDYMQRINHQTIVVEK